MEADSVEAMPATNCSAPLGTPATAPGSAAPRAIPPAAAGNLLRAVRDMALEAFLGLVAHALDKADDALFELADKAENDAQQRVYFDAMRDVRLRRAGIETAVKAHLVDRFDRRPGAGTHDRPGSEAPGTTLGLVENDELEISLAVRNMVTKALAECEDELYPLQRRIGHLLGEPELDGARNPLGPESLCATLRDASDTLEAELPVRLLVLKLFDRHVLGGLGELYRGLNHHLIAHNVLPTVQRPSQGRAMVRPGRGPGAPGRPAAAAPSGALDPEVMALIQELAAATRPGQSVSIAGAGTSYGATVQALTALQSGRVTTFEGTALEGLPLDPGLVSVGTVNVLRELRTGGLTRQMDQLDDLMLEVVTLLFDYVLDDKSIPDTLKALIGRLQIPMLKVAILDKALFARKSHPARRLLNTLAEASVGWDETRDGNDELFRAIERVVQRILADFDQNVDLFAELVEEFEAFLVAQEQRATQRAEVSAKILQGRERLEQAKAAADAEVRRALASPALPQPVREFVDRHWRNLLVVTHNREGDGSELWRTRVEGLQALVWSVSPKRTPAERRELLAALPALVRALNETIHGLGMADGEREQFLVALSRCHAAALRGEAPSEPAAPAPRPEPEPGSCAPQEPDTVVEPAPEAPPAAFGARPARAAEVLDLPPGLDPEAVVEEIVIETVADETVVEVAPPPQPEHDPHLEVAQKLAMGTWVEFLGENGGRTRARLTWVSSVTGIYLFTDRRGMKVAERTPAGLAADFRRGSARVLDAVPLFDRAVSHLMKGLRRTPSDPA
jgi:hypothetical protein